MKLIMVMSLALFFLSIACEEEKFEEKRALLGDGGGEQSSDVSQDEGPIVVTVVPEEEGDEEGTETETDSDTIKVDKGQCAKAVGAERVKISGSQHEETLTAGDAYSLKVTGNQNKVDLEMKGSETDGAISGICLDLAGNQNQVSLKIAVAVETIYIRARGNQPSVNIQVDKDGSVATIKVDKAGHAPEIKIEGEGKYPTEAL